MAAPVNTVAPAITGTAEVGYTLSVSNGTWTGGVTSYSYQWQESLNGSLIWTDITGATTSDHLIIADDVSHKLRCAVTATNNTGSTLAYSDETITIADDWFIVEDGTAKSDANSYLSILDADLYHAQRNNAAWALLLIGQKKSALVKATDYLVQAYRLKYKGSRVSAEQSLDWPRNYVTRDDFIASQLNGYQMIGGVYYYPNNVVVQEVKNACAELALKSLSGDLSPDLTRRTTREKVDVIEVEYSDYGAEYVRYRAIDNLLAPFIDEGMSGAVRKVIR